MGRRRELLLAVCVCVIAVMSPAVTPVFVEEPFSKTVGDVKFGTVTQTAPMQVPFITWGGDLATFHANGGLTTKKGTIFQKQGLNLKLVPGDDFRAQVRDYISGKSPFLRGTFRMIGLASEVIAQDARTKGVVIMQMTWSAGDHMVVRPGIKSVTELKGKKIVLQRGGPHIGLLDDILRTGQLNWDDITVVWADDLTATPKSPAEMFRKDRSFDACLVITPDMIGLCGGIQNTGSGAEGTVKSARVLVSTAELSRSIADVYVCRKDFYDANKPLVTKFVAGYFKACEEVIALKKDYESKGSAAYMKLLKTAQDIYGKDVLPTLEEDAHGLVSDCTFVGYPGNIAFFEDAKNLNGFQAFEKSALDLATSRGYVGVRAGLFPSGLDYRAPAFTSYLTITEVKRKEGRYRAEAVLDEIEQLSAGGDLDKQTIVSFTISFEPNQSAFSEQQYGVEYQRVVEMAGKYGNAVIAVRGHSDPTKTLLELVQAGIKKGVLKRSGTRGNYKYSLNGRPLNLNSTEEIQRLIEAGGFDGVSEHNPRATMQAALNLSRRRAEAVRDSVIAYANGKGLHLDQTQIQPVGVGIREPFIAKPRNADEAGQNMRVEFRLLRVTAEVSSPSDFDF